jgi:catechol 2,3-dioxygenase-like lactoylglutathione lyase family enzyme
VKRRFSAASIGAIVTVALASVVLTATPGRSAGGAAPSSTAGALPVSAVSTVGMTVSNIEQAVAFYTGVLAFEQVADQEHSGREFELLVGIFGARARTVTLRLGAECLALTEFLAPRGRPFPVDFRPNDVAFQHVAIIVSDMDRAYERLRASGVAHGSSGPQRLPDWNPNAGGIKAFYFRDPDGHFLEVLQFPPGKGAEQWHRTEPLFLGIDHTAIVSADTEQSLGFYRDLLNMKVAGESENHDIEQEHLNNVFGARLRITALRAGSGPGIELLEYLAPRTGRPVPIDARPNDVAHWQTRLVVPALDAVPALARRHLLSLISPRQVDRHDDQRTPSMLVRDPDGHAIELTTSR